MVKSKFSNWDVVEYRVPQGSSLGLLLFIMITNDMVECIRNCNVLLYVHDTAIYRSDFDVTRNYRDIQGDLKRLYKWFTNNGLAIDSRKTKVVNFGSTKKIKTVNDLHINKEILMPERQYKYLGVFATA